MRNLLAIDPSLTCTGWALFSIRNRGQLLGVGSIRPPGPGIAMATRLVELQRQAAALLERAEIGSEDVLISEAQTTLRDPRAAFLVEQVRGIFETLARSRSASVPGRINPRSVHFEILGLRGRQLQRPIIKDMAVRVAERLYGDRLKEIGFPADPANLRSRQDIVDALLVGGLALTRIESALTAGLGIAELFESESPSRRRRTGAVKH